MNLQFDIPMTNSIIKVFGVGGGGSNAVNHMYKLGIKGVDFVICNTDAQALELSPIPLKLQIGSNLTDGRGAGSKPEVGEKAAMESIEEIKNVLAHHTKMVFITAGMGGGTGTGAAPVIARAAKELGILTVGIVSKPFLFEGPQRNGKAREGIENLKKYVDTLLVIDNERLREIFGNAKFSEAFAQADNILATAAKGIAEIITVTGYINVDFEDVKTVMSESGVAIMGCGLGVGEDRALNAVKGALDSPLLSDNNIHGAANILLNITSGTDEISMDEISQITSYIQEEAGADTNIIWGHCNDDSLDDKLMVTLIATGFEGKYRAQEEKVVHSLNETPAERTTEIELIVNNNPPAPVVAEEEIWEPMIKTTKPELKPQDVASLRTEHKHETVKVETLSLFEEEEYSSEPVLKTVSKKDDYINPAPARSEDVKNPQNLDSIEKVPAYIRKKIKLQNVPHSSESNISRYNLLDDPQEDSPSLHARNTFLHDNVD